MTTQLTKPSALHTNRNRGPHRPQSLCTKRYQNKTSVLLEECLEVGRWLVTRRTCEWLFCHQLESTRITELQVTTRESGTPGPTLHADNTTVRLARFIGFRANRWSIRSIDFYLFGLSTTVVIIIIDDINTDRRLTGLIMRHNGICIERVVEVLVVEYIDNSTHRLTIDLLDRPAATHTDSPVRTTVVIHGYKRRLAWYSGLWFWCIGHVSCTVTRQVIDNDASGFFVACLHVTRYYRSYSATPFSILKSTHGH